MEINHIIRGEDHIPNTPKQILLYEALGFDLPQFAHLPLILGTDRSKMSKRHGSVSIKQYKRKDIYQKQWLILWFTWLESWNRKRNFFNAFFNQRIFP